MLETCLPQIISYLFLRQISIILKNLKEFPFGIISYYHHLEEKSQSIRTSTSMLLEINRKTQARGREAAAAMTTSGIFAKNLKLQCYPHLPENKPHWLHCGCKGLGPKNPSDSKRPWEVDIRKLLRYYLVSRMPSSPHKSQKINCQNLIKLIVYEPVDLAWKSSHP